MSEREREIIPRARSRFYCSLGASRCPLSTVDPVNTPPFHHSSLFCSTRPLHRSRSMGERLRQDAPLLILSLRQSQMKCAPSVDATPRTTLHLCAPALAWPKSASCRSFAVGLCSDTHTQSTWARAACASCNLHYRICWGLTTEERVVTGTMWCRPGIPIP